MLVQRQREILIVDSDRPSSKPDRRNRRPSNRSSVVIFHSWARGAVTVPFPSAAACPPSGNSP